MPWSKGEGREGKGKEGGRAKEKERENVIKAI